MINIHPWIIYGIRGVKAPVVRVKAPTRAKIKRPQVKVKRARVKRAQVQRAPTRVKVQASAGTNWEEFLTVGIMPIIFLWGSIWIVRGFRKNPKT